VEAAENIRKPALALAPVLVRISVLLRRLLLILILNR